MKQYQGIIEIALKGVALGMATAVVVLGMLKAVSIEASITMLGIGLFTLALAALQKES